MEYERSSHVSQVFLPLIFPILITLWNAFFSHENERKISQKMISTINLSLFWKKRYCGIALPYRIPYRTAASQYRTVPQHLYFSHTVPVRYGIGTAYRRSLVYNRRKHRPGRNRKVFQIFDFATI
jgi:hypothetical protein